jgi:hypothetical protein
MFATERKYAIVNIYWAHRPNVAIGTWPDRQRRKFSRFRGNSEALCAPLTAAQLTRKI